MKITFIIISLVISLNIFAQDYSNIAIKEDYDQFNTEEILEYKPCIFDIISVSNDGPFLGDGMSKILEGYVTMHKTTGDKAYLYKFIFQSMCVMQARHDIIGYDDLAPRWTDNMYQNGYILAAFSKFIHYIKIEKPELFNMSMYNFPIFSSNNFGITFTTFGQYADWLQDRVGESLYWHINKGYWDNQLGMKVQPGDYGAAVINMQVGFARAFLFNGLTAGNQDFLNKAMLIANKLKSAVYVEDICENKTNKSRKLFGKIVTIKNDKFFIV